MNSLRHLVIAFFLVIVSVQCAEVTDDYRTNPTRFENSILAFEKEDEKKQPPDNAILFVGSSSIVHWHRRIHQDMAPLTVMARGFGGSNMNDALYYMDRIVFPYNPRALVLFEGGNDLAQGVSKENVVKEFKTFLAKLRGKYPDIRLYFLAIKFSPRREKNVELVKATNISIKEICDRDEKTTYVDVASPLLDAEGGVRKDIFQKDMLHMNEEGYRIWTKLLKPILIENESKYEKKK